MKELIRRFGLLNLLMVLVVLSIIIVAETMFLKGYELHAIFVGLWAPTLLGFMILFKQKP